MTREARIGLWTGGISLGLVIAGILFKGYVWAHDTRYVTHEALQVKTTEIISAVETTVKSARRQDLNEIILSLQLKVENKEASKSDRAMLEYYKRQYGETQTIAQAQK